MNKTITNPNEDGLTRLQAVERYQKGETQVEVAKAFGVHYTTIAQWVKMYEEGGVERLNVPRKPRPVHVLDTIQLENSLLDAVGEKEKRKLSALLELSKTGKLNETADSFNITPQYLAKWRREYLSGAVEIVRVLPHAAIREIALYEETKRKLEAGEYTRPQDVTKMRRKLAKIEKRLPELREIAKKYNPNMAHQKGKRK